MSENVRSIELKVTNATSGMVYVSGFELLSENTQWIDGEQPVHGEGFGPGQSKTYGVYVSQNDPAVFMVAFEQVGAVAMFTLTMRTDNGTGCIPQGSLNANPGNPTQVGSPWHVLYANATIQDA